MARPKLSPALSQPTCRDCSSGRRWWRPVLEPAAARLVVVWQSDRCAAAWWIRRTGFADAAGSIRIVVRSGKIVAGCAPYRGMQTGGACPSDDETSARTERDGNDHDRAGWH